MNKFIHLTTNKDGHDLVYFINIEYIIYLSKNRNGSCYIMFLDSRNEKPVKIEIPSPIEDVLEDLNRAGGRFLYVLGPNYSLTYPLYLNTRYITHFIVDPQNDGSTLFCDVKTGIEGSDHIFYGYSSLVELL